MYTVVGISVTEEEFERLRPILENVEETPRLTLKQGELKLRGIFGGSLCISVDYSGAAENKDMG